MPLSDSPFGMLPTNLPQVGGPGMPAPTPMQGGQMQQMPGLMQATAAPSPMATPQRSELESIISGIGGLLQHNRDDEEKKQKAEDAKAILAQLMALKTAKGETGDAQNSWRPGSGRTTRSEQEMFNDDGTQYGPADIDQYMKLNAQFESGDNLDATNAGSGASGIYQFLPSTWNWIAREAPELGLTPEGIRSRDQQNKAMRYYTQKSTNILAPILGRKPTGGELYLLHLLGHSGGPAVLANIEAPITQTISEGAYRGNPFLKQYNTGRDLIAGLNRTFGGVRANG